jgi:hypothetical protein
MPYWDEDQSANTYERWRGFAYLFLFPRCARVLCGLSRITGAVIVSVLWALLCAYCFFFNDADLGSTTAGVLRIIPAFIAGYWLHRVLKTWSAGDTVMCIALCGLVVLMCTPSSLLFLVFR